MVPGTRKYINPDFSLGFLFSHIEVFASAIASDDLGFPAAQLSQVMASY